MGERVHWRGAWHRCRPHFFSGDEVAARSLRLRYRRRGRGEEKEKWSRVFGGGARPAGFLMPRAVRSTARSRRTATSDWASAAAQAGKGARPKSRPRPRLRPGRRGALARAAGPRLAGPSALARARAGRGPRVCWLGRNGQMNRKDTVLFFLFSRKQFDQFELIFYDNFLYKIYPTIFFVQ